MIDTDDPQQILADLMDSIESGETPDNEETRGLVRGLLDRVEPARKPSAYAQRAAAQYRGAEIAKNQVQNLAHGALAGTETIARGAGNLFRYVASGGTAAPEQPNEHDLSRLVPPAGQGFLERDLMLAAGGMAPLVPLGAGAIPAMALQGGEANLEAGGSPAAVLGGAALGAGAAVVPMGKTGLLGGMGVGVGMDVANRALMGEAQDPEASMRSGMALSLIAGLLHAARPTPAYRAELERVLVETGHGDAVEAVRKAEAQEAASADMPTRAVEPIQEPAAAEPIPTVEPKPAAKTVGPETMHLGPEATAAEATVSIKNAATEAMRADFGLPPATKAERATTTVDVDTPQQATLSSVPDTNPSERTYVTNSGEPISTKHATLDPIRAAFGEEPARGTGKTFEGVNKLAAETMASDPTSGTRLVEDLQNNPRALSPEDDALLTHELNRLRIERNAAEKSLVDAAERGDDLTDAKTRVQKAQDEFLRATEVAGQVGTEAGQALAFRRLAINEDYSLAAMETAVRIAQDGLPLTEKQSAEIKRLSEELAKAQAEGESHKQRADAAEREADAIKQFGKLKNKAARRNPQRETAQKNIRKQIEESHSRIAALARRARSNLPDPELLAEVVNNARLHVELGVSEFKAWADDLVNTIGEYIRPHLEEAWNKATAAYHGELASRVAERLKDGTSIRAQVDQLARHFVEQNPNIERDQLVGKVHEVLKDHLTREQTADAISGYGEFKQLTKDEISVKLRQLKGEMQQAAKLRDMAKGQAPLKTGVERREPSSAERRLIKQVNEAKKKLGIRTGNPETQLKSALDSAETRLRNQIEDLSNAIARMEPIQTSRTAGPTSPEVEALKAQRDALRMTYDEVFAKPHEPQAKDISALEKQIADFGKQKPGPKQGPDVAKVAELKARLAALRAERDAARNAALPKQHERLVAALDKQIAEFGKEKLGARQGPDTPEVAARRARLAALRAERDYAERIANKRNPDEIAAQAYITRKANEEARLRERITYQDFTNEPRQPRKLTEPELAAKAAYEQTRKQFQRELIQYEMAHRTKARVAIDAVKERVNLLRSARSAFDLSAVLRQGLVFTVSRPKDVPGNIKRMLKAAASEEYALRTDVEIRNRPAYRFSELSKLELTRHGDDIGPHEEAIRSRLSDNIPGIKASNRAFITYLNLQRSAAFEALLPESPTIEQGKAIANFINVATGRGNPGKFASAVNGLGYVLWSPRLLLSRIQLIAGQPLYKGDATTRKIIAKEYARFLAGMGVVYSLARLFGADVEEDPRSSDFGKIRVGDARIDPMAGLLQVSVLASRVTSGETKTGSGAIVPIRGDVPYGKDDTADVLARFARTKFNPALGTIVNVLSGQTVTGEKPTVMGELAPLSLGDVYEAMRKEGVPAGAAMGILSVFGAGLQEYR